MANSTSKITNLIWISNENSIGLSIPTIKEEDFMKGQVYKEEKK